jgi:hypothetical protein
LKNKGLTTNFIKECKPDVSDVGPLPSDKIINSVAIQNGNPGQKGKTYNQDTQGLVVRRAEDISIAPANAKSIFVSRCDVETVDSIVNNLNMRFNKFDGCKGVERKFLESVFYVNESNQLVRKDSGNDGFEVIAENVEHMRVEINYPTVSIYLLVRNSEESLGSLKTPTFVMGSVELGGLDSKYRYRVFSTTVEMTNESGRL